MSVIDMATLSSYLTPFKHTSLPLCDLHAYGIFLTVRLSDEIFIIRHLPLCQR